MKTTRVVVSSVFALVCMAFWGCAQGNSHIPWKVLEVPGGSLHIEYDPPPIFGSHTLYFSYISDKSPEPQPLGSRELNNDGANLGDHNLEIRETTEHTLKFVLRGQQQEDEVLLLNVEDEKAVLRGE